MPSVVIISFILTISLFIRIRENPCADNAAICSFILLFLSNTKGEYNITFVLSFNASKKFTISVTVSFFTILPDIGEYVTPILA